MASHRYDEGVAEFVRAVEIDPLWGLSYDHLVGALTLVGRRAEAQSYARRFLSLSTDQRAKLLVMRGLANLDNRFADELKVMRLLHRAYPQERQMRFSLATILALLGEHKEALEVIGNDRLAFAVLTRDWDALAKQARATGPDFWEQWGFWNMSNLLLASGHGGVLVELYDRDRALIDAGRIDRDNVQVPELVVALRRAGRRAEADRILARFEEQKARVPDVGLHGIQKQAASSWVAALRGDREQALRGLEKLARERPTTFAHVPAMSLRFEPALGSLVNEPRFAALDERLRGAINAERAKAEQPPIGRAAWTSDPKSLLTKN